jgi:hypothetical protein
VKNKNQGYAYPAGKGYGLYFGLSDGDGFGSGYGNGFGCGFSELDGFSYGNGLGNGDGYCDGNGNGDGGGYYWGFVAPGSSGDCRYPHYLVTRPEAKVKSPRERKINNKLEAGG